ncbi:glycosidase [Sphingomonas sp. So64.6b]|uniref:glycoside hydrolase family 130 protein n=1 Tax=Sphingomonas sp. So64.6b TaxID=2997354 RepID=UPI0016020ECB|nr:glycoside hydrolase family 130 protein [Sphingomonas sp. So64.6b]QNA82972.1 glycosidase [Sphingomonas sp. So64.6b]
MAGTDIMTHSALILRPDPSRTVIRPFSLEDPAPFIVKDHPRAERIIARVMSLDDDELRTELDRVVTSLSERHRDVEETLLRRFAEIDALTAEEEKLDRDRSLLIGAYFSEEYSFESAALFNPSIILHPDQSGLAEGTIRFAMSLRGIGEGHVSSVTFRCGTWAADGYVTIDPPSATVVSPRIKSVQGNGDDAITQIDFPGSEDPSETVLFPVTPSQHQGIEDLRMVRFVEDDGSIQYLGTYTAFSGSAARSELLRAHDFRTFEMRPLRGAAAAAKGMALFPRRIDGRYAMLSRQDNENIWLMYSDDLYTWDSGEKIVSPTWFWEFVQMGNCGSPIEIEEGWLLLTHGVGTVRNYCIGACLLDKDDPSKVIKRMKLPLVHPSPKERDGYVPNVVYSCGALVHDRRLLLPYGVADSFTTFASVALDDLLAVMV